ncbi:hypothetical protein DV735_g5599, partial [Chaetothyriales sp. CBS 134920]
MTFSSHAYSAPPPLDEVHPALRPPPLSLSSSSYYSDDFSADSQQAAMKEPPPPNSDVSPISSAASSVHFGASDTSLVSPIDSSFSIPPRPPQSLQAAQQQYRPDEHQTAPAAAAAANTLKAEMTRAGREKKEKSRWKLDIADQNTRSSSIPSPKLASPLPLELQYPQLKDRTRQILAGLRDRDAAKKSGRGRDADPMDQPAQKVPWKGASGRTTLVDPVQNTPAARTGPLQPTHGSDGKGKHGRPAVEEAYARSTSPRLQHPKQQPHTPTAQQTGHARPSPDIGQHSVYMVPSNADTSLFLPLKPRTPSPSSSVDQQSNSSDDQPAMLPQGGEGSAKLQQHLRAKFSFEPDSAPGTPASTIRRKAVNPGAQNPTVAHLQREPESRQSWTTYASTQANDSPVSLAPTVLASSPPPSPLPPLPSPVVVRKRVPESRYSSYTGSNTSSPSTVSRKPVASDRHRSVSNASNASKSLPPTPVELEAGDKISSLEARLDDLARRRGNNTKINRELRASLARNAITYDMRKRREVEQLIATLSLELDDIGREQHDVALSLHRARKKRDRDSCYENPTGLWIRRVTS